MNEKATEMAGFLDGRDYTAAFLYEFFALLVGNGVYANELTPTATNEDMTITHGSGHAWINGVCYRNTVPFVLEIDTADGSLNRYDSLMVRLNLSANEAYAVVVQGEYATTPVPPACTRNAETYDLKLCDIYIPAGCTKITQAQITDTRLDAAVCGVPVFPVQHLDMTTFYNQIVTDLANFREKHQADFSAWTKEEFDKFIEWREKFQTGGKKDFDTWFAGIKNQLSTDAAGNLQNQIDEIRNANAKTEYTAALNTAWEPAPDGGYMQSAAVIGILETDAPRYSVDLSGLTLAQTKAAIDGFSEIYRLTTSDGMVTAYSYRELSTALRINLEVLR